MKRIITLAIMALLIGGFTISANAQTRRPEQQTVTKPKSSGQAQTDNAPMALKNLEHHLNYNIKNDLDRFGSNSQYEDYEYLENRINNNIKEAEAAREKARTDARIADYQERFDKASKKLDEYKERFNQICNSRKAQQTNTVERPTVDGNEVVSMLQNSDGNNGGSSSQVSNTSTPKKPKHTSNSASQSNANNLGSTENLLKSFEQAVNDGCQLYSTIKQRNNGKAMSKQDQVAINKKIQLAKQSKNSVSVSALNNSQKARYDKASKNLDSLINKYEHAKKS